MAAPRNAPRLSGPGGAAEAALTRLYDNLVKMAPKLSDLAGNHGRADLIVGAKRG